MQLTKSIIKNSNWTFKFLPNLTQTGFTTGRIQNSTRLDISKTPVTTYLNPFMYIVTLMIHWMPTSYVSAVTVGSISVQSQTVLVVSVQISNQLPVDEHERCITICIICMFDFMNSELFSYINSSCYLLNHSFYFINIQFII